MLTDLSCISLDRSPCCCQMRSINIVRELRLLHDMVQLTVGDVMEQPTMWPPLVQAAQKMPQGRLQTSLVLVGRRAACLHFESCFSST